MRSLRRVVVVVAQCLALTACSSGGKPPPDPPPPADVRRYGAVCDGRADDSQALIRAGQASLEVLIPAGLSCRVTRPLAAGIRPGQRWHGGGAVVTDDGFNFTVFSVAGKTDVMFDGLAGRSGIPGVNHLSANARFIEFISGAHRGRVLRSRISGFQQAVRIHGSTDVVIADNELSNVDGWGISIQTGAHRAEVARNRVTGTVKEHGIYASASPGDRVRGLVLRDNTVSGSRIDGVKLTYTEDAVVEGNTASSNGGQGIYVTIGNLRADVRSNRARSNGDNGILVYDASTTSSDNRVAGNKVRDNRGHGVFVTSAGDGSVVATKVTGNEIEANGDGGTGYGIVVSGPPSTRGTVIEGNSIRRQRVGVYVAGGRDTAVGLNSCDGCDIAVVMPPESVAR